MRSSIACQVGLAAVLLGLAAYRLVAAGEISLPVLGLTSLVPAEPQEAPPADLKPQEFKPRWKVGQKWVVETVSSQTQINRDLKGAPKPKPVKWHFEVQGIEKVGGDDCYKVEIKCEAGKRVQPVTTIWSNAKTMMMQQFKTQVPVQGEFRPVTEQYKQSGARPAPVIAPLSVLPLEMPVFLDDAGTKEGKQTFDYEVISGPGEAKALGDVSFGIQVEQEVSAPPADYAKGLNLPEDFSKGLEKAPLMKVEIKASRKGKVEQLWQPGKPWPVFSKNGATEARLVSVTDPSK